MGWIRTSKFIAYCKEQRGLSEHTLRAYRQDVEAFRLFWQRQGAGEAPCPDTILAFQMHLRDVKGNSPATVRRRMVTLRAYFKWLEHEQQNSISPFTGLQLDLKVPKRLPRPVDRPTLAEVLRSARSGLHNQDKPVHTSSCRQLGRAEVTGLVVRLLIVTGLRIGELTQVRVTDVSAAGRRIRVRGKGNRERTVYVTDEALLRDFAALLHIRQRTSGTQAHVFLNTRGSRLTEAAFRKRLKALSKDLDITPHLTPHRLRHSAATLLVEEGVDIRIVQRLLGHASISTTEIYTKVSDSSLLKAIQHADTLAKIASQLR